VQNVELLNVKLVVRIVTTVLQSKAHSVTRFIQTRTDTCTDWTHRHCYLVTAHITALL